MAKIPTTWANNDVKPVTGYTPVPKVASSWTNNDTKNPTIFTAVTKSVDAWSRTSPALQTYLYDDPAITYSDLNTQYDYLINGNQLNQRQVTRWSAT